MPVLEAYANPQGADFEKLDLAGAEKLDKLNKEAHFRNGLLLKHAQLALLEVDPSNRKLKSLQQPAPPESIVKRVQDRIAAEEAKKKAEEERAAKAAARNTP